MLLLLVMTQDDKFRLKMSFAIRFYTIFSSRNMDFLVLYRWFFVISQEATLQLELLFLERFESVQEPKMRFEVNRFQL